MNTHGSADSLLAEPALLTIKMEPTTLKLELGVVPPSLLHAGTDPTVHGKTLCLKHLSRVLVAYTIMPTDHEAVVVNNVIGKTTLDSNELVCTLQAENHRLQESVTRLEEKVRDARRERRWMRAMVESLQGAMHECTGHHRYRWPSQALRQPGPDDFCSTSPEPDIGSQPLDGDDNNDEDWA